MATQKNGKADAHAKQSRENRKWNPWGELTCDRKNLAFYSRFQIGVKFPESTTFVRNNSLTTIQPSLQRFYNVNKMKRSNEDDFVRWNVSLPHFKKYMRTSLLFVKSTKKSNIRFDLGKTSNIPLCYNKLLKIENCFERNKKNIFEVYCENK